MEGNCLCGEVSFELTGEFSPAYQCHCSRCCRVSGTLFTSVLVVRKDNFKWLSGRESISCYVSSSGFKSEFCRSCGSPVPSINSDQDTYRVPTGLISDYLETMLDAQDHINSRVIRSESLNK
ncbi:GFA family protein [Vibrio owensii]|uniref:GFA family protein n=1 Tax=Vibrio owensii TaxID=696485 RepID=UPI003AAF2F5B